MNSGGIELACTGCQRSAAQRNISKMPHGPSDLSQIISIWDQMECHKLFRRDGIDSLNSIHLCLPS